MEPRVTFIETLQGFTLESPDFKIILLSFIMIFSGFISGVTGFGFSFFGALGLFLFEPKDLIPLLLMLSTVTQFASIWSLRDSMVPLSRWWVDGPLPFIVGGAMGVPIGICLLYALNAQALCELVGFIILAYSAWSFFSKPRTVRPLLQTKARIMTGFTGGVIGGFTAAPGSAVAIWGTLTGTSKEKQRAIVQPFIVCIQLFALYEQMTKPNGIPIELIIYAAILCIAILPVNQLGVMVFRKIKDLTFRRAVLVLLAGMGIALIDKGFHIWGELFISIHFNHPLFGIG
jgi:uncharacterized protein